MKITLHNGKTYDVWFHYDKELKETMAVLDDLENNVLYRGLSKCSKKDVFNKVSGRKIALKKLFKQYFPGFENRTFRTNIWTALANTGMRLHG